MIVDSHAHVNAPAELYAWQGHLVSNRANPDSGPPTIGNAGNLDTRAFSKV